MGDRHYTHFYASGACTGQRARARGISHGQLSRAGSRNIGRRTRSRDWGRRSHLARRRSDFHRRAAASAETIPGSVWLPDTGYGTLAAATEDYLRHGLARASGGNNAKLLVIYCQADCWMSWNAAKRALSYGYPNVAWYPEGTDGWLRANLPVAESQPESRAGEEESSPR